MPPSEEAPLHPPDLQRFLLNDPRLRCDHVDLPLELLQLLSAASPVAHAGISHHDCRENQLPSPLFLTHPFPYDLHRQLDLNAMLLTGRRSGVPDPIFSLLVRVARALPADWIPTQGSDAGAESWVRTPRCPCLTPCFRSPGHHLITHELQALWTETETCLTFLIETLGPSMELNPTA